VETPQSPAQLSRLRDLAQVAAFSLDEANQFASAGGMRGTKRQLTGLLAQEFRPYVNAEARQWLHFAAQVAGGPMTQRFAIIGPPACVIFHPFARRVIQKSVSGMGSLPSSSACF
jgi:hypothetical protein